MLAAILFSNTKLGTVPYRQLLGQLADHAVQVVGQTVEFLVGGLKKVWTSSGEQTQCPPAIVWVPDDPEGGMQRWKIEASTFLFIFFFNQVEWNLLVLFFHHVDRVGLFDGFGEEFIQRGHELSAMK